MVADAPVEKITVKVMGKSLVLDPANMKYNENSLSDYMSREYGWIDYYGKQLEFAQKEVLFADIDAEKIYGEKYLFSKDEGRTDTYAKAYAQSHPDYVAARKLVAECKETVGHLKAHLKAWDKNHENVQNRGHTLRKEMDKLNRDIFPDVEEVPFDVEDVLGE